MEAKPGAWAAVDERLFQAVKLGVVVRPQCALAAVSSGLKKRYQARRRPIVDVLSADVELASVLVLLAFAQMR